MAVPVSSTSIMMPAAASSTEQPRVDSFGTLKTCVARAVGAETQQHYLDLAADGILRAIDVLNIKNVMEFARVAVADTAMVAGTGSYALPADFFAVSDIQVVDATENTPVRQLEFQDWHKFNRDNPRQEEEGGPRVWFQRNLYVDEQYTVYPTPDTVAAADEELRLTYYRRIERPEDDSDIIVAPRELSTVLCVYAEAYVLDIANSRDKERVNRKFREFDELRRGFRNQTERQPDELRQFTIARGSTNRRFVGPRCRQVTFK